MLIRDTSTASERDHLSAGAALLVAAVVLAFADIGLSRSASLAMAPESVPFLLTAVFVFVAAIAAGGWAMLRLARLAGARGVGPSGEGFVIMLVTLLGYELLRWRMAGSSPPALVGVVVLAAAVPAAAFSCRRRVGMFALAVGASLLSGLWAVGASLTALGNPTAHALREGRAIWGGALFVTVQQFLWFAACLMLWGWLPALSRRRGLAVALRAATLALVGCAWLAGTNALLRFDTSIGAPGSAVVPASLSLPNIVLLVLDTVRADRTDLVDPTLENTPSMLALGHSGAVYSQAYANSTWSLPSHATLFTGLYPHRHGAGYRIVEVQPMSDSQYPGRLVIEPVPLAEDHETLAELLAQQGYATAAFAANYGYFSPVFGLLQGFTHVESEAKNALAIETIVAPVLRRAPASMEARFLWWTRQIVDSHEWVPRALRWIDERPEGRQPFFLFMNWMDAHEPGVIVGRPGLSVAPPSGRGVFRTYDTSLRYQDEALGQLLDGLSDRALLNNTLVVVTSDHGEAVGASGHRHGGIVRQHQVRIPLVVSGPGVSGGVVAHPVQLADIPVWILRMVGATIPSDLDGTPLDGSGTVLVENYFGHSANETGVTFENVDERRPTSWAILADGWKLLRDARGQEQLFNVHADPDERADQFAQNPDVASRLRAQLDDVLPLDIERRRLAVSRRDEIDEATLERLRSLGYVR